MATVDLVGLTKIFGSNVKAVDALNLHIDHGELVSFLGPSGCGKTTTLRLIAGFLEPDAGEIRVDGKVISSSSRVIPPERRDMSMIFQSYAIWPHMTVYQNAAYGLKFRGGTRADTERKVRRILEVVRLDSLADRYPGELSGGQQQRVALARALVVEPKILLLDEPLSNLDANLREEMRFEIRRLHDEFKITSIYVTHDQSEAMVIADRVCVMHQGRIEQLGTAQEIFDRPQTRFVAEFIGKTNILAGRMEEGNRLVLGEGLRFTVAEAANSSANSKSVVCIRPHNITLVGDESQARQMAANGYNLFAGVVQRRFYFGDAFDYIVGLPSSPLTLRVVAPPSHRYDVGSKVFAVVHPDHCVPVRAG
ncbi:MAG TPA: ABC transporter ATP-binding protein [Candidatus Binatia bacterium]|nr:ABC transporter ATP-binding protein [Candidatus Binatia bacterium]